MIIWKGIPVCGGIAVGTARVYRRTAEEVKKKHIEDYKAEAAKYAEVKSLALDELERLFCKAADEVGEKEAQIFSIHKMMLEDCCYNESVLEIIEKQRVNAEAAVLMTSDSFERLFHDMDNAYMRERAGDIRDVSDRVIALLSGKSRPYPDAAEENTIIFADNIAPSEAMQMDKRKVCAFVTEGGSGTTHTAVLARSIGIPAVARVKMSSDIDGKLAAVDGFTGTVYIEPDERLIKKLEREAKKRAEKNKAAEQVKKTAAVTRSGRKITVSADISEPEEAKNALSAGCDGIGIFRSETIYKNGKDLPCESYQFDAYRKVIEGAGGRTVTIRTLDMDADKKGDFFGIFREKNPSMGMMSIRICLMRPEIFKIQLRAVLKASECGRVRIALPMIVSSEEVIAAKKIIDEVKRELSAGDIPVGIMIETPAAVLISEELTQIADFFVIDSDNLAQYILATDRQNPALADIFDMRHSAVLKAIGIAAASAKKRGIGVSLCGALASDADMISRLLDMGIEEFSVKPQKALDIKRAVFESR